MLVANSISSIGVNFLNDLDHASEKTIHLNHYPLVSPNRPEALILSPYIDAPTTLPILRF